MQATDLDLWEEKIEAEKAEICYQSLGINIDDVVIFESGGKFNRFQLDPATLHVDGEEICCHLGWRRYRKDGLIGKNDEYFVLKDENNQTR